MDKNEALRRAADYLSRNGHIQGNLYQYNEGAPMPSACALGALRMVARESDGGWLQMPTYAEACHRLVEHLRNQGAIPNEYVDIDPSALIPMWNDDPSTTAEDVILAMKMAAEEEE